MTRLPWTTIRWTRGAAGPQYRGYELVPSPEATRRTSPLDHGAPARASWTRRRVLVRGCACMCLAAPVLLLLVLLLNGVPSTYSDIRTYEQRLPQHENATTLEDRRMYLRFPGHLIGHGWNNVLQEAASLAHDNRTYVFEDYTWSQSPLPYTVSWPDFSLRPSRIPLNAFISGPLAGGAPEEPHKRAVSAAFFEQVCARDQIRTVRATADTPSGEMGASTLEVLDWWVEHLKSVEGVRCVEIASEEPVFNRYFFGSEHILALLPALFASPILSKFTWSPLVRSAVARNFAVLRPLDNAQLYPPLRNFNSPIAPSNETFAGLLAVHLRQGDYVRHCPRLAAWNSTYLGINTHPALPDRFVAGAGTESESETAAEYMQHCLPSVEQLVQRLHTVRAEHGDEGSPLQRVFLLTNARTGVVSELRERLLEDGWTDVWSSYDLLLDSAQKGVAMAVDMSIAESAAVFLGNGFSSLTGNVVMLRLARGLDPRTMRFL
ncbi:unnamed protein product [Mycena citricolor]|uniref:Uncharacterized protein n=1 Tax=Mycena citricolor TaxID=2018698 RepID=A0AAD2JXA5_9AGAR|nr:unnamed protein product [Mycena citricolor]